MRHSLSCACATNCFAHAHTIALCMFAQLLCACPIYTSHRHAHAIALHMRKPLLCTCAGQCLAHARPIALHMRKLLLCTCAPHYTAHVHNSQTCTRAVNKACLVAFEANSAKTSVSDKVRLVLGERSA